MANEDRRLAAIMFSDICGYSKAMGEDEQRALLLVETHNNTIRAASEQHGGRIIKTMGDGILVEFASAVNAVKCALQIQRAIGEFNRRAPEHERILLRIGIHLGDVIVADNDILGDGVNVASRIEPLAEPGGICISRDIFDLVKNNIAIEAVHLGARELKNISKQVSIYKLLVDAVGEGSTGNATPTGTHRVPRALLIAGFAASLIAAAAGAAFLTVWPRISAKRDFLKVTELARRQAGTGRLEEAVATLESYPSRHADTQWQRKIDDALTRISRDLSARQLRRRCGSFLEALRSGDKQVMIEFVDPKAVTDLGHENVGFRIGLLSLVTKLTTLSPNDIRIVSIDLAEDGATGTVSVEVFRKTKEDPTGAWHRVPDSHWKQTDDQWYVMTEPTQALPQRPAQQPLKGRQPHRPGPVRRPGRTKPPL